MVSLPKIQIQLATASCLVLGVGFCSWVSALAARLIAAAPDHWWTLLLACGAVGGAVLSTGVSFAAGAYQIGRGEAAVGVAAAGFLAGCVGVLLVVLISPSPVNWDEAWLAGTETALAITGTHAVVLLLASIAQRSGLLRRRVALVTFPNAGEPAVVDRIKMAPSIDITVETDVGDLDVAIRAANEGLLDEIILVARASDKNIAPVLAALDCVCVDIALTANGCRSVMHDGFGRPIDEELRWMRRERQVGAAYAVKRFADVVGASLALIVLSPLLLTIALIVKIDSPGPALFLQERFGFRGRTFVMWKFRSMRNDAADATGSRLTDRNDARVTRVGGFLRRTSLDELPQLVNILRGDLSFVGPRPHPSGAKAAGILYDDLIPNFKARYRVRPGVTGLAQCMGLRGNTDTEKKLLDRFEADIRYVETWSLGLDAMIVVRTIGHLFRAENAY